MVPFNEKNMNPTRTYLVDSFNNHFPGKGSELEEVLYKHVVTIHQGWDFYPFRKEYLRLSKAILFQLEQPSSILKQEIYTALLSIWQPVAMLLQLKVVQLISLELLDYRFV